MRRKKLFGQPNSISFTLQTHLTLISLRPYFFSVASSSLLRLIPVTLPKIQHTVILQHRCEDRRTVVQVLDIQD